ncbi:hypothetical protein [Pseudoflavitalea rhizosphaerae]|uniref:hypothetical protein n=1 Tax=Pseudoflavitalea rhizosphaerae TaxID=1884793 RepID=UPI000F8DAF31|nr:hypothetical protein [Pseudoflavitalea rhizosphaerae]
MTENFESKKNMQAGTYTAIICGALLLIFLFVRWSLPPIPEPPVEEGIEVNLGSSDQGFGDDQPFEPGSPAPAEQASYTPPPPTPTPDAPDKEVEADDAPSDPVEVKKPEVTKTAVKKIPEKATVKTPPVKKPVEAPPAPAPPKPKATMRGIGGTGTGGNEADSYKKGGNQGVAGGTGDQGRPGGNPNSDSYTGGGRGNGITVSKGLNGRRPISLPSFTDDFNENATVYVDIRIDETGKVISATFQPKGSTTLEAKYKSIAIEKAKKVKFNSGDGESVGTLKFNFRVQN